MDEDRLFQKFSLKQCIVVCEVLPKEQIETLLAGIDAEANSTENDITDSNLASPTSSSSDTVPFHTLSNSEPFSDTESTDVQSDSATVEGLLPEGSPCAEPNSSAAEPEAAELETCLLTPTQTCTPFSIALVPLTKPCFVMVEKLSQNFIRKALKGRVHWKDYFNDPALAAARKRTFEEVTSEPEFEDEEESDDAPSYDEEEEEDYDEPKKKRLRKKSVSAPRRVVLHQCERCTFSGTSKKQLMLHSTCHKDNVDPLRCELCPAIAYSIADMKRHIYEFHEGPEKLPKEVIYGCKGCTPVQKFSDLQTCNYHVVNHVTPCEKGYKCAVCNNTYLKYQTFTEHMSAHILLKCTFCEKMYPKLEAIESHCQTSHFHYGRPFGCELCPFRSAVFGLLLQHRDERHGIMRDKGFDRCKFCIDTIFPFSDYESMLFHLADHADVKLFNCPMCSFSGKSAMDIAEHVQAMHQEETQDMQSITIDGPDIKKLVDGVLFYIRYHSASAKRAQQSARSRPSFSETQEAVQALLQTSSTSEMSEMDFPDHAIESLVPSDP